MKLVTTTGDLAAFFDSKSIAAPIRAMKQTGFTHLDLSFYGIIYPGSLWIASGDSWKKEVEQAAEYAQAGGFDFCQAHSPDGEHFAEGEKKDALILATKRSIEACGMLHIPHTVVHGQGVEQKEMFRKKNAEFLRLFANEATENKVDILFENSSRAWNPCYYGSTGAEMLEFVREANLPYLHICWDTGHANVEGLDQYGEILAMGEELRALHIQDNYGDADSHVMPLVGTTNFDRVLKALLEAGYKGDFTFEGSNTVRFPNSWPHYRKFQSENDRVSAPPLFIRQKQISVMYDIGKWMLESYGIPVE